MANAPAGFIVALDGSAAVPTGWVRETSLDGVHPKGAAAGADPGVAGGADTHVHVSPTHTHTVAAHTHAGAATGTPANNPPAGADTPSPSIASSSHSHTTPTTGSTAASLTASSATWGSATNDPPNYTVRWIRSLGTAQVPSGAWCYWDNATLPASWSSPAAVRTKYLKGAAPGANGGGTGGSAAAHTHAATAHTHSIAAHAHTSAATTAANATSTVSAPVVTTASGPTHTHSVTPSSTAPESSSSTASASTGSTSAEVPYVILGIVQNDTGGSALPLNLIGLWIGLLSAIPLSLHILDGTGGTQDARGKYVKGADISAGSFVSIGSTGGSLTHDHSDPATHTHTYAHTHTAAVSAASSASAIVDSSGAAHRGTPSVHLHGTGSVTLGSSSGTSGNGTQTVDDANGEPSNLTAIWVKYTGAIDVTITSPTSGDVLTSPAFTPTWTLSAGTQTSKRVRIFASDATTLVYDSGVIADTTQSYDVPSTSGLRTGFSYYLQIDIVNNGSLPGSSAQLPFSTSWTPPSTPTGLTATAIGGTS